MLGRDRRRLARRLLQLYVGLAVFGWSEALLVEAHLGVLPWDVLHQGLARHLGLTIGIWSVLVALVVLLLWIPLRERPGLGTLSNALVIGPCIDVSLAFMPTPAEWWLKAVYVIVAIVVNALATALYIGAAFGPGPRDGLMTGFVQRTGGSIRVVRTIIEVVVVIAGWLLGGTLGIATVLFVFSIGPLVQIFLPLLHVQPGRPGQRGPDPDA